MPTIMLVGAPVLRAGGWQEEDLTVNTLLPAFISIGSEDWSSIVQYAYSVEAAPPSTTALPAWRSLPLKGEPAPIPWSQRDLQLGASFGVDHDDRHHNDVDISFLTNTAPSSSPASPTEDIELTQYLEASLALHEDADETHLIPASATQASMPYSPAALSAKNAVKTPAAHAHLQPLPELTALSALPKAATLNQLHPQTMTVDLIAGIISASAPRTVAVRKTGRSIDLVEVLLGDETKAGFGMTFWLPELRSRIDRQADPAEGLRKAVLALRAGHVVCLRNVALRSFKGVVHGQTLGARGRIASATTVVRVEESLDVKRDVGGVVAAKIDRVRAWTRQFVRPSGVGYRTPLGSGRGKKRAFDSVGRSELPPDETQ